MQTVGKLLVFKNELLRVFIHASISLRLDLIIKVCAGAEFAQTFLRYLTILIWTYSKLLLYFDSAYSILILSFSKLEKDELWNLPENSTK